MDNEFLKKLNDFYFITTLGIYVDKIIKHNNYSLVYSNNIKDIDSNFAFNLNVQNEQEFNKTFDEIKTEMIQLNRKPTFSITPLQSFLYSNKDKIFNDRFNNVSKEVWQIFDDFDTLDNIKVDSNYYINLEKVVDFKKLGQILLESYKGDECDPYNGLDIEYMNSMAKYNDEDTISSLNNDFYFIKYNGEIIGTISTSYNESFFNIHGFAIKKAFRRKGIGKIVLKEILKKCKEINKIAFIQTEDGFYPADLYRKIGFKDVCVEYFYQEK